jgi:hypothetical protein
MGDYKQFDSRTVFARVEGLGPYAVVVTTPKELLENYTIVECCLVRNCDLEKFHKKHGTCGFNEEQANLYNLMNSEFLAEADEDLWDYYKSVREQRKAFNSR